MYYNFQKDLMLQKSRQELTLFANEQISKLKELHANFEYQRIYPRSGDFESGIYDSAYKQIFATFGDDEVAFDAVVYLKDDFIYLIKEPESYYLGTKYLVLRVFSDPLWLSNLYKTMAVYGAILLLLLMVFGGFLARVILQPMRDAIALLDRFIKDTTHELNTPVNTILSNIEMIDQAGLDAKLRNKIRRVDIGARTISNLYEDLTYLMLSHKIISKDALVVLDELIEERVHYFALFAESRKIEITTDLQGEVELYIDRKKMSKLIDNLLSNAIKYNKMQGSIRVCLGKNFIEIGNNGRGVSQDQIDTMFVRYARGDSSVGGFGIGLSIVSLIAKEYGLHVKMQSRENEWTQVRVQW